MADWRREEFESMDVTLADHYDRLDRRPDIDEDEPEEREEDPSEYAFMPGD